MGLRSDSSGGAGAIFGRSRQESEGKIMLEPKTCTIKEACDYAQELKRSFTDIQEGETITLQASAQEFLIAFLTLTHLNGDRIEELTAEIKIAPKPANCDRPGTSQTCYYIKPRDGSQFQPVWFADCRASVRVTRIKGTGSQS